MGGFVKLYWIITAFAIVPACIDFSTAMRAGVSATQQAGPAAVAIYSIIIPYVFTRAMAGIRGQEPFFFAPSLKKKYRQDSSNAAVKSDIIGSVLSKRERLPTGRDAMANICLDLPDWIMGALNNDADHMR